MCTQVDLSDDADDAQEEALNNEEMATELISHLTGLWGQPGGGDDDGDFMGAEDDDDDDGDEFQDDVEMVLMSFPSSSLLLRSELFCARIERWR